jgi:predicted transposase/invertase (TIGR01784 family)
MNEETYQIISDKLKIITVELPKFNKQAEDLDTILDCWLFCFKHLPKLEKQPPEIKGEMFDKLFEQIRINKLTTEDMAIYERSVTEYHDVQLAMKCSHDKGFRAGEEQGIEKGIERGIISRNFQIAKEMQKAEMSVDLITQLTGLSPRQIRQIKG